MQPSDIITLRAFLAALSQLDEPLPPDIQTRLNEIAQALTMDPSNLVNLDVIAQSYQPLDTVYQQELTALKTEARERNKGSKPPPLSNKPTKELTNAAIDTFNASDSVAAAKAKQNILTRIWQNILQRIQQFFSGNT
ncbi:MAG: hypothetical protein F6K58_11495 [Symploca sp. SIO2E9]|nr:hypothetical protein [Symploca sp. SIO2E9]